MIERAKGTELIDADGHYYEPDDCFSRHIEARFAADTIRVERGDDGLGRVFRGDRRTFMSVMPGDYASAPGALQGLFMGEVAPDDAAIPYAAARAYLMAGSTKGNLGFSYANPIVDANGKVHGVLCLYRSLAAGPLNHDQPALVRALVLLLGENLASAPVI